MTLCIIIDAMATPQRIRTLRPGEPVPDWPPRRYPDRKGYIRCRWRVGVGEQVETLEHRIVDGRVTTAQHVHHINHVTSDNRPENLLPMHGSTHMQGHYSERERIDWAEARRLYESGIGTLEVGRTLGANAATIYRGLRRRGVEMRPLGRHFTDVVRENQRAGALRSWAPGGRRRAS